MKRREQRIRKKKAKEVLDAADVRMLWEALRLDKQRDKTKRMYEV